MKKAYIHVNKKGTQHHPRGILSFKKNTKNTPEKGIYIEYAILFMLLNRKYKHEY